jgi:hypothetical protein
VVGIVAARIKDRYHRPTIVASVHPAPTETNPDGIIWKGSGRSIEPCHMENLFSRALAGEMIVGGGGHHMAGGLSFTDGQKDVLQNNLGMLSHLTKAQLVPVVEAIAPASRLSPSDWASVFRKLKPFGQANRAPALLVEAAELLGVRVRTWRSGQAGPKKLEPDPDEKKTEAAPDSGLPQATRIPAAEEGIPLSGALVEQLPKVRAYEGVFEDRITGRIILAQWQDLEAAEYLWQVHLFRGQGTSSAPPASLPIFRLHLELRAFVPRDQHALAKAGKKFSWDYNFQIRQCLAISRRPLEELRMPVVSLAQTCGEI